MLDLKFIYDYFKDIDDLFDFKITFRKEANDLMVSLPNWMMNSGGTWIADFVETEFYDKKRITDYRESYENMTITIQRVSKSCYWVVIDFNLMEVAGTTEVVPEVAEDPK